MQYQILCAPFPFGNLESKKFRPVLCLSEPLGKYQELVLAYITSNTTGNILPTDVLITTKSPDFPATGLKIDSVIKLHKLFTLPKSMILGKLGSLSDTQKNDVREKLRSVFDIADL